MDAQNSMLNPRVSSGADVDEGRRKHTIDMLRDTFLEKYRKNHPEQSITPQVISYIEKRLEAALPSSYRCPHHPPYHYMIISAIKKLNSEGGSTEDAISEYIETNFTGLPWAHRNFLKSNLEKLSINGEIVVSNDNRYRLPVDNPVVEDEQKLSDKRSGGPTKRSYGKQKTGTREKNKAQADDNQVGDTEGENREGRRYPKRNRKARSESIGGEIQGNRRYPKRDRKTIAEEKNVQMRAKENAGEFIKNTERAEAEQAHQKTVEGQSNLEKHKINVNSDQTETVDAKLNVERLVREKEAGEEGTESIERQLISLVKGMQQNSHDEHGRNRSDLALPDHKVEATMNHQSLTATIVNSSREAGEQNLCLNCQDPLCAQERKRLEDEVNKLRSEFSALEMKNLREEIARMGRYIQYLASKIPEGAISGERRKHGDNHCAASALQELSQQKQLQDPNSAFKELGNGHEPSELQQSTISVVNFDSEAHKQQQLQELQSGAEQKATQPQCNPASASQELQQANAEQPPKTELQVAVTTRWQQQNPQSTELSSQAGSPSAFSHHEVVKKNQFKKQRRIQKPKVAMHSNVEVGVSDHPVLQSPQRRGRKRLLKQKPDEITTLQDAMYVDNGNDQELQTMMQNDIQTNLIEMPGQSMPSKRKLDGDSGMDGKLAPRGRGRPRKLKV